MAGTPNRLGNFNSGAPTRGSRLGVFERRVLLLTVIALCALAALSVQLLRLGVFEHATHSKNVERYLVQRRLLPASRGRILDRRGEVLACDRASWEVSLEYDAITGRWATDMARRDLVREMGRTEWLEMSPAERTAAILVRQEKFDAQFETIETAVVQAGGFDRAELDARLDAIIARAARESKSRKQALVEREVRLYGDDARLTDIDRERVGAQLEAHVVLEDVSDEVAFNFQRLAEEMPGTVVVEPSTRRAHPWDEIRLQVSRDTFPTPIRSSKDLALQFDGVADHLLGSTRTQVFPEDLARRPLVDPATGEMRDLGGYRHDRDTIGASGVERRGEDILRGIRGVVERDIEHAQETRIEPINGRDVQLTIDIRLQSRLQALLAPQTGLAKIAQYQRGFDPEGNPRSGPLPVGWELDGAIVVIDVASGEVLAAVSSPTLADGTRMTPERRALEHPEIFRPLEAIYPPGSILKPLVFCAAVAEGVVRVDETVECRGHFFEDSVDSVRCWIYRPKEGRSTTHGALDGAGALARSCNIYFYTMAARLGPDRLLHWLNAFGLGRSPETGLAITRSNSDGSTQSVGESAGSLPDAQLLQSFREKRDRVSPLLLGIGQGAMTWTPVQAAQSFATLARGGIVLPSRIIRGGESPLPIDLHIPAAAIKAALEGLRASVNESYGTGHHITLEGGVREELFDIPDLATWGKTGTATAPKFALDGDKDGVAETNVQTDHAWFAGLVAPQGAAPQYAIAVILEHGGSGGKVAGPVAAEVMRALAAEGYLGARAQATAGGVVADSSGAKP